MKISTVWHGSSFGKLRMTILLFVFSLFMGGAAMAQPDVFSDRAGQMWNVANGYYGTINANTIDAGVALDSVYGTTKYFSIADWPRTGGRRYDSARILAVNPSGNPYYQPYSQGLSGRGIFSISVEVLKASFTSTVTPTVTVTPEQSATGATGSFVTVPSVTVATVNPTSRTVASVTTFNFSDIYQKYQRVKVVATDSASVRVFYNYKPKTY